MINLLNETIKKIDALPDKAPHKANIKGKWYSLVATRVSIFREVFGTDANIKTEVLHDDLERVVVKAIILIRQREMWEEVATGFAEEWRGANMINKTSAIENCETSAIGRALSNLGLSGGEYASEFEVDNAINNKAKAPDLSTRYVLLSDKGAKIASFEDLGGYCDALRKVAGKPSDDKCRAHYEANKKTIKEIQDNLPEGDPFVKVFSDLVDAYETVA